MFIYDNRLFKQKDILFSTKVSRYNAILTLLQYVGQLCFEKLLIRVNTFCHHVEHSRPVETNDISFFFFFFFFCAKNLRIARWPAEKFGSQSSLVCRGPMQNAQGIFCYYFRFLCLTRVKVLRRLQLASLKVVVLSTEYSRYWNWISFLIRNPSCNCT